MNFTNIKLLKWFSIPMMVILMMLVSCEKMDMGSPYHYDGSYINSLDGDLSCYADFEGRINIRK